MKNLIKNVKLTKKPDDAIATYEQETVASERYDSSLVLRKVSEPQYGNDETYSEDKICNNQLESKYETAEIETNSKDHISNDELEPKFETDETYSKDNFSNDELEPEYETNEVPKLKPPQKQLMIDMTRRLRSVIG